MCAGSVYDGIKITKLDEYDMDIVIRLPISYDEGIIVENERPGFVKMKIGNAFDNLAKQPEWENCHKVTYTWRDDEKYFLQNKFRHWVQGIVQRALNEMEYKVCVNGVVYLLKYTQSGPAYTLKIKADESQEENEPFHLDVDLVPVIRFRYPRWPQGYRTPLNNDIKNWLVVPKPNKALEDIALQNRCWRLSFQEFERDMMKGCQNLKKTIRLVKKLRDVLRLKAIASYYIKTLFLWKISETSKKYWETKPSVLFQTMVAILRDAIEKKNIQYFWHKEHNLIKDLTDKDREDYVCKLKPVLDGIKNNEMEAVLNGLLTKAEQVQFKRQDFYQKLNGGAATTSKAQAAKPSQVDRELVHTLMSKIDQLTSKVDKIREEMSKLKVGNDLKEEFLNIVGDVDEISDEIEDLGYDVDYSPKRLKMPDGSGRTPKY
ncbi:cyclic GMP-AMP synthase-like receptor isoform X2 [Amyelois transitella]|nr:cyclic GMP-AMP synthase-like receptor isoform X2 [Amyelois transitella]XP_060801024.1 cyclic GMP-AMP synthase-like receptor isoform X2 [Amyelois transitella]